MTTGKTIALTICTFVSKVMSLFFNMLSRFVIDLPRSRLQSPSAVILEPKKIKSVTVSIVSPSLCHEVIWPLGTSKAGRLEFISGPHLNLFVKQFLA